MPMNFYFMDMKYLLIIIACLFVSMEAVSIVQEISSDIPNVQYTQLPVKIFAGEVHYSRIPVEYWEHRIQMIKALGLNTLSVYIMWNYHETKKGQFDFETGNRNLPKFLDLAKKHGLYVLIRPGPYVCAEWDYGGMPARLLNIPNLVIRSNNKQFLAQTKTYFEALSKILIQYSAKNGGPIILLQIQNEYGFYAKDKSYIDFLRKMWTDLKVEIDQYYVDIANNTKVCHWQGANIGINNFKTEQQYQYVRQFEKKGYILAGQDYTGWLTHWGEQWASKTIQQMEQVFGFLLKNKHSFSMYMVHGGSNFGLTAGANRNSNTGKYQGHITSYDYDAPISQQGRATNKYVFLRELLKNYVEWDVPQIPEPIPVRTIQPFTPALKGLLFEKLPQPSQINVKKPSVFESKALEMYDQGMVLYTTYLSKHNYYFKIEVHDFAIIYLDGQYFKTISRSQSVVHSIGIGCQNDKCKLDILVQAMGHINFDHAMTTDHKGLYSIVDDQKTPLDWTSTKLPIEYVNSLKFSELQLQGKIDSPAIFEAQITIDEPADTYFNMQQYIKGYVWINGINLGRYWNIGPQQKLFCPGVWLNKGKNTIRVLQLLQNTAKTIKGDTSRV